MYVGWLTIALALPVASAEINQGSVSGRVIDIATKHPIPDASVTIYGTNAGTVTDSVGRFSLTGLNEGLYKLEFGHIAYHRFLETDVRVVRNKTTSVEEIELAPAIMMAAEVTVSTTSFQENPQAPVSHYTYTGEEIRRSDERGFGVLPTIGLKLEL